MKGLLTGTSGLEDPIPLAVRCSLCLWPSSDCLQINQNHRSLAVQLLQAMEDAQWARDRGKALHNLGVTQADVPLIYGEHYILEGEHGPKSRPLPALLAVWPCKQQEQSHIVEEDSNSMFSCHSRPKALECKVCFSPNS